MKKVLSKILCGAMVLMIALSGCSAKAPQSTSSNAAGTTFPLKTKATLTAFVMNTQAVFDFNNNYVTKEFEKENNVKIDFKYSVFGDDGKTKLNLLMSSNDLPDIFLTTGWTKAQTLLYGQEGLIIPLNKYLENSSNWNDLNKESPLRKADITLPNGNIYTYGQDSECLHCNYQARMWIYKPWVDKLLNGKMPTTTDEFYKYLQLVKTKDPNGDGKADEIPLTGFTASGGWASDPTNFLINSFVQNNNFLSNTNPTVGAGFVVNGGKVEYQFNKPAYKEALTYINKLYKEKLLDNATFTQDATQEKAITQGTVPIAGAVAGGYWPCESTALSKHVTGKWPSEWQSWVALSPLKGPDGVQLAAYYPTDYFAMCNGVVSKSCKDPALAVKVLDTLATKRWTLIQNYGPENIGWKYVKSGTSINGGTSEYKAMTASKFTKNNYPDWGLGFADYIWPSDTTLAHSTSAFRNAEDAGDPKFNSEALLYNYGKAYSKYTPKADSMMPNIAFDEDSATKVADYSASIGKYSNQATVQFITGDLDVNKDWNTYTKKLNDMDLSGYIAVEQKGYDTYSKSLKK